MNDIRAHPILSVLSQVVGIIFAIVLFCLVLTFCQFKQVQQQYESVRNFEPGLSSAGSGSSSARSTSIVDDDAEESQP